MGTPAVSDLTSATLLSSARSFAFSDMLNASLRCDFFLMSSTLRASSDFTIFLWSELIAFFVSVSVGGRCELDGPVPFFIYQAFMVLGMAALR